MKILAVDSSSKTASAALFEDRKLTAQSSVLTETHSAVLLPMIEDMLKAVKTAVRDVDLMAVTVGPGSFTGVRIGVSLVKGLAFADKVPCVGVSTLEAMAAPFGGTEGLIVPVIDARRETVFSAVFRSSADGTVTRLTEDAQMSLTELMTALSAYGDERIYFTGDAMETVLAREDCPSGASGVTGAAVTPPGLRSCAAIGAGILAYEIYTAPGAVKEDFTDAALVPAYLKKSQAERERDERIAAAAGKN